MRLKTRYSIKRGWSKDCRRYWFLLKLDEDGNWNVSEMGTKKECRAKMAALKRRDYLSSIADRRESQRRELREGAE